MSSPGKRVIQTALVGAAVYAAYLAMQERQKIATLRSLASQTGIQKALAEGVTEQDVERARARKMAASSATLQKAIHTRALKGDELITRTDILIAAKKFCEQQGGNFSDIQNWEGSNWEGKGSEEQDIDGVYNMDLGLSVAFACVFGPDACRQMAADHPDKYFDYDYQREECVDRSPQRDMCEMTSLADFCEKHKDFCKDGELTMGLHLSEGISKDEYDMYMRYNKTKKPMGMTWDYGRRTCLITEEYCDSIGQSFRRNAMGITDCYVPAFQRIAEGAMDSTTVRRMRVLWGQAGQGDVEALGLMVVSAGLMVAGPWTFGLTTVAAPFMLASYETKGDRTGKYKSNNRWLKWSV